ncbi:hypothetical protein EKK58_01385 [Candidatus Dependentiae bacterium]|nr:MAG: hypothetical protein EKK58_01385 [Candidatus Dependentiae bacterium]
MPLLDIAASFIAQQGIFPQPQGNNSVMDMMMLRSRNMDQHYIMKRALASSQMAARMGGINMDSPFYQALYPFAAMPDSPLWKVMSPMIGGNPVRAQMGLYADLNGQTLSSLGRLGSTTALETDRMMDQLQGRFYRRADFGKYVNSTEQPLRAAFGDAGFERLNKDWSMSTIRGLEGTGITRVNRDVGNLLESSLSRITRVREAKDVSDTDKQTEIEKIRAEARAAADSFLASVSSRDAQQKMGKSFADALQSENAKDALKQFKNEWKGDIQDAFRLAERGVDFKTGKVPGSIDYRFTRGFNIEDITGSFGAAASAGMVGRNAGLNIGKYGESAMGALDAARGLFGRDLSGRELTDEINKLVGIGSVNLTDSGDARKLEEMLRNVKAMARVAGVSIESMKGVIDEAKMLAAQNPNLPLGIGGFTAANIATQAMGDTTAALTYMDPALARALGGAVGINSGRIAALTQGLGEPTSRILGALHYHALQVGGEGSSTARAIRDFAQNGDTTSLGLNSFIQKIAPSLNMSPYQALNFAQTNPLAANLGLERTPELGRAGVTAMKTTLLREWDAYTGGTAGFGRELMNVAWDPKYASMSEEEVLRDVQGRLNRPLTSAQQAQLRNVRNRASAKKQNNEGLMSMTDIMTVGGIQDPRGTARRMVQTGYDIEFTQDFNPRAKAAHRMVTESRKNSAKLEAFHAANLAEINAPMMQRLFQAGLDGRLADGGVEELRRIFSGAPDATAYAEGLKNLQEADRLYNALPEGRLDEAGNMVGGASDAQVQEVLRKLYPGLDVSKIASAERIMGRDTLGRLGKLQTAGDTIAAGLLSGGITNYGELEEFLGRQTNVPTALREAIEARKNSGDKKVSRGELEAIAKRIKEGALGVDTDAITGKFAGKGMSPAELAAAAKGFGRIDPDGQFAGELTNRNVLNYGIQNLRFQSRSQSARAEGALIVQQLEALGGDDEARSFKSLQKMYAGEIDFSSSGVGRYTDKINADVLMGIADESDPSRAAALAGSALSQAGLSDDPSLLIEAARKLRKFDSGRILGGSRRVTNEDLIRAARSSKISKAHELLLSPFQREAGENAWSHMAIDSEATGTMHGKLAKIRSELLEGRGDFSVLSEKLQKNPELRKRLDDILGEGEPVSGEGAGKSKQLFDRYLSQYEEAKKNIEASSEGGKSTNPLAGLDIKGVINAISSLTSAVNSAAKTP